MNYLREHDACPNCWHHPGLNKDNGGMGTFSIQNLITYRGGTLDKNNTCTQCNWNFFCVHNCKCCKPSQPCHRDYATGYNGVFHDKMSLTLHRLYMRNSPYDRNWVNRPMCIGAWYATHVEKYEDVVSTIRRFTSDMNVHMALNHLETQLKYNYNRYPTFWSLFHSICLQYFNGNDAISQAVNSYYQTLRANHFHVY